MALSGLVPGSPSGSRLPVLVDFYSPGCGPCRSLAPVLDSMANRFYRKVVIAKVNTELHHGSAQRFGIKGVPTLLFFHGNAGNISRLVVDFDLRVEFVGQGYLNGREWSILGYADTADRGREWIAESGGLW